MIICLRGDRIKLSDDIRKKEVEIQILQKVFGENIVYEESEQPDFILKHGENIQHGVEITELYYDGTSARIKNEKYIKELFEKRRYWHKDDKRKIKINDVKYYAKEKGYQPIQIPVLFLPKYNMKDYGKSLKQTIESKNKKLEKYCSDISQNCMLIIYDKENPFEKINEKDIAKQLFTSDLLKVIRESDYQEIYLVTGINSKSKYVPLKAYLLQSDFILFREFIKDRNLISKLEKTYNHPLLAFAEISLRRGGSVTFGTVDIGKDEKKLVAYHGMYGIGMTIFDDGNWGIDIFDTYPLQNIPNTVEFKLEPSTDFFDDDLYMEYEKMVQTQIASTGLFFATK